jgi:ankyrin repeat protein
VKKNHANKQLESVLNKYASLDMFEGCLISSPTSSNEDGDTPFHIAAYDGDMEGMAIMLPYICDINIKGDIGNTALHYAISNRQLEMVKALISYGANINQGNDYGDTPMDYMKDEEEFSTIVAELNDL